MQLRLALVAAACVGFAATQVASADPIGPDCDTCQGGVYELLYNPVPLASDADSTVYGVVLRIDTTGYTGDGASIGDVAFKVSPNLDGVSVLDAPGGAGDWSSILGNLNANGCNDNADNSGFGCAASTDDGNATLPFAGIYQWIFAADVPNGTLLTDAFEASIKVRFLDADGDKTGDLVSENITLQVVPEPGTLLLLAGGLAGLLRFGSPRRS